MIKKGDIVRVIPSSYFELCKGQLNSPAVWKPADHRNNDVVMLGGKYQVLDIHTEKSGRYFKLIEKGKNNQDMVHEKFVVPDSDFSPCPFSVGDKVVFDLSDEKAREMISFLHLYGYAENKNKEHEVMHILNDYYVFIDNDLGDPHSFPFEWNNFKKIG
jgi:hypothetical protein